MICDICSSDTCEWNNCDGKKYCPRCYQDAQERGELPLTRHANVHNCCICGKKVCEYGFKVKIGGETWVCMECAVEE